MSDPAKVLVEEDGADENLLSHDEKQNGVKIVATNGEKNDLGNTKQDFLRKIFSKYQISNCFFDIFVNLPTIIYVRKGCSEQDY